MHHYILLNSDPEEHNKINRQLIGNFTTRERKIDERAGFAPPSWWKGDDFASHSGLAAAVSLKR